MRFRMQLGAAEKRNRTHERKELRLGKRNGSREVVATLYKLPVGGKTKLDVGGLRAHCAARVCAGEAASVVEDLLGLVEAMAERMQRMEVRMAHLLKSQYGRRSEQVPSA